MYQLSLFAYTICGVRGGGEEERERERERKREGGREQKREKERKREGKERGKKREMEYGWKGKYEIETLYLCF